MLDSHLLDRRGLILGLNLAVGYLVLHMTSNRSIFLILVPTRGRIREKSNQLTFSVQSKNALLRRLLIGVVALAIYHKVIIYKMEKFLILQLVGLSHCQSQSVPMLIWWPSL